MISNLNKSPHEKYTTPQPLDQLSHIQIQKIVCGTDHTFALSYDNKIYAWGSNVNSKLGLGNIMKEQVAYPEQITALNDKFIDNICTGNDHSYAWSSSTGLVYGWGSGAYGKLGFGDTETINKPKLLDCLKEVVQFGMKICDISCGESHSLAILDTNTEEGDDMKKLFVWGSSRQWQLGLDIEVDEDVHEPHQIDPDPWDGCIELVYACNNYSACLTKEGKIYTWGSGEFGRLGYETETKQQKIPRLVAAITNLVITKLSLGGYHAACITESGELYTWGRGINGQLGHATINDEEIPKKLNFFVADERARDVACGENHTICISNKDFIYSWGAGQFGQLGQSEIARLNKPEKILQLSQKQITWVSCGKRHSAVITKTGQVYIWGSNDSGQLGLSKKGIGENFSRDYSSKNELESINNSLTKNRPVSVGRSHLKLLRDSNNFNPDKNTTFGLISNMNQNIQPQPSGESQKNIFQWDDVQIKKLAQENKLLKSRVKQLELNQINSLLSNSFDSLFDLSQKYMKAMEEQLVTSTNDDSEMEVFAANAQLDKLFDDYQFKVNELKKPNVMTALFCLQQLERFLKLIKRANYSIIAKNFQ